MMLTFIISLIFLTACRARIHELTIESDERPYITLTSFGFYQRGYLNVSLQNFNFHPSTNTLFGLTLEKVMNDALDPHVENYREKCMLEPRTDEGDASTIDDIIFFRFNLTSETIDVACPSESIVTNLLIYKDPSALYGTSVNENLHIENETSVETGKVSRGFKCTEKTGLPLLKENGSYKTQFLISVPTTNEEGLYNLVFYSCANYHDGEPVRSDFTVHIIEHNIGSYLSAGDMPLPTLYKMMSLIFFLAAIFWIYILHQSRHPVFKIHYLMAALMILKALGLLFHGINYYFIEIRGEHVATWAILYYVTHLLKGSVLFITIILIGTGWTFIKHILSPKDKRIFMIVIPLQVFANVAEIIIDESEEGDLEHRLWLDLFTFVDLLCCFAILFPIIWSIKHLQDASQTDGKAAINLRKLKLFRHFYIMIVCYIYFTRIIVYLLKMTVPFQYSWLDEMFREVATFVFFVVTGYKFRPASENPYFYVPEDDDAEIEIVFSQCGLAEGLSKLNRVSNEAGHEDKDTLLVSKRESSYDYD